MGDAAEVLCNVHKRIHHVRVAMGALAPQLVLQDWPCENAGLYTQASAAHRAAGSMGLATGALMPAAKQRWRSAPPALAMMALAVMAMTGNCA